MKLGVHLVNFTLPGEDSRGESERVRTVGRFSVVTAGGSEPVKLVGAVEPSYL